MTETTPEQTLLIHRYDDGGARFAWTRDLGAVDQTFWRIASSDEMETYIICEMMYKPECRDLAMQFAVQEYGRDPVAATQLVRMVCAIEEGAL